MSQGASPAGEHANPEPLFCTPMDLRHCTTRRWPARCAIGHHSRSDQLQFAFCKNTARFSFTGIGHKALRSNLNDILVLDSTLRFDTISDDNRIGHAIVLRFDRIRYARDPIATRGSRVIGWRS